jgi:hypothetical protein
MATGNVEREVLQLLASAFPQSADRLRGQIEALANLTAVQNDRVRENTDALAQNSASRSSGASQAASTGRTILSALGGGLFLSPLINGIARLFRGSPQQEPVAPLPVVRPSPLSPQAALFPGGGGYSSFDFDQFGRPRQIAAQDLGELRIGTATALESSLLASKLLADTTKRSDLREDVNGGQTQETLSGPVSLPQVTIQIQALDSRSILDRSDDIARAVREAMLHSHSVNDVIGEV